MKHLALPLILIAAAAWAGEPKAKKPVAASALSDLKLVEGDEKGNEIKSLKAELLVSAAEGRAVDQARKLLLKYKGTPVEPDLHFRLAELYMRRAKTDRFFEVHRESETVVKLAPRITKLASSRASIQAAIGEYNAIQKNFATFPQMDVVVFNHAFAVQTLGDAKGAEILYKQLVSKFSDSPLVPDTYLALGEIEFDRNQFGQALEFFNSIRKYPDSRVYPYGLYKAAWALYNMHDAGKGLKKLEEVVAFGKMVAEKHIDARLDLRKEALNDMTLFYEDVYPAKDANAYFSQQAGESEVGPILLKMGSLYERHSRFMEQRTVLDQFIKDQPMSPILPQVHTDLANAHDHMRQKDLAVLRLKAFADLCQSDSDWSRKNKGVECMSVLNDSALKFAKKWLATWKKIPADATYADSSEKAFEIYLRNPGDSEEVPQSRFAYAELLFARNKFRQASKEYAIVSQSPKAGKISHDASYAAVLSLEKAVGEKWSADDEKTFHQLASNYVVQNPKGQYRLDVEYKMALLAYDKNRYDEAAPIFLRLGKEFAGQEKGHKSQDLYLDILNIKKDYRGIRNYAQDLIKAKPAAERETKLHKLYEQAYFLEVQGMEEKAQYKEALLEYLNFAKNNPKSELTEKAVWNAMQLQFKLEDAFNGSKTAVEFASRFPKSPKAIDALLRAAQSFESMGQLQEAAQVLEKLAVKDEKSTRRWRELAADFYAMTGAHTQARAIYTELKAKADAANKGRLLSKLEAFEKSYGTARTQAEIQKQMVDAGIQPQASNVKVAAIEQMYDHGRQSDAFNEARHALGSASMNANQKARLRLLQAKVLEKEFLGQSVKSRAEKVATVLAIKTEKLQKAQEALQGAIKYGDPTVSMDAFERLYNCYAHYVKALKEMPVPTGLTAEDAKAFRAELDNLVVPLEEKSVDTLVQAVQFARQQSILTNKAAHLEAELDRVNQSNSSTFLIPVAEPQIVVPVLAGVWP